MSPAKRAPQARGESRSARRASEPEPREESPARESRRRDNSDDDGAYLPGNPFLERARREWQEANAAESDNRKEALEDLKFLNLEQWPENIKALRNQDGKERATLTIDQISPPYRQLLSNQLRSDASITVVPELGKANEDEAKLIQGLMRAIEYESDAQGHYSHLFGCAVGPGWGFLRLRSEYESPEAWDQKLVIEALENPMSCYIDPSARKPLREDMRFAFITEDLPYAKYRELYGESKVAELDMERMRSGGGRGLQEFTGIGDAVQDWFPEGGAMVRIAEYYRVEYEEKTLREGTDGKGYLEGAPLPPNVTLTGRKRRTRIPFVTWCKINGVEIIEGERLENGRIRQTRGRRIPGQTIPIRPCFGEVLNVNGKRVYRGMVRAARDSQRQYNYQNSELVQELAIAPRAPVIGYEGQFEGYEDDWNTANVKQHAFLQVKPITLAGTLAPLPKRPDGVDSSKIQALVLAINQAKTDLRSTTGWYDATDPNRRNADQSGRAIIARKTSQDENGIPFFQNFRRTLVSFGRLMLEWLPETYDRPERIVQVLGAEDKAEFAMVGPQGFIVGDDGQPQAAPELLSGDQRREQVRTLDLSADDRKYGVRVTLGASYTTRRQEAAETIGGILEKAPALLNVIGDLFFKNLDIPDAEEIAERVKRTIPPNILGDDENDLPPQAQAKLAEAKQLIERLMADVEEKTKLLETKQLELQSKESIARHELQGEMAIARLKAETDVLKAELGAQMRQLAEEVKLIIAGQREAAAAVRAEQGREERVLDSMAGLDEGIVPPAGGGME